MFDPESHLLNYDDANFVWSHLNNPAEERRTIVELDHAKALLFTGLDCGNWVVCGGEYLFRIIGKFTSLTEDVSFLGHLVIGTDKIVVARWVPETDTVSFIGKDNFFQIAGCNFWKM